MQNLTTKRYGHNDPMYKYLRFTTFLRISTETGMAVYTYISAPGAQGLTWIIHELMIRLRYRKLSQRNSIHFNCLIL